MIKNPTGLSSINPTPAGSSIPQAIFAARVKFSIVDDKEQPEVFKEFGEWSCIGGIFFDKLNVPNPNPEFTTDNYAKPLFPNNSTIPLKNELVYIMTMPNSDVQSNVNSQTFYYFQPINVWGSTHHNAIPDPIYSDSLPESQTQDYEQTSVGNVRRVTDGGTEIDLGKDFKEKLSVRNLQPYAGDLIYQGRWGQSLRFSSTLKEALIPNTWSNSGEDGDPITIIKNGQHEEDTEPWVPQVEDINKEGSSVYITSTQIIPIEVSSKSYKSYSSPPTTPDKYDGEQIILNSGRLVLNAKTDSILLSAADTINLNSVGSVNIDSPKTVIQSDEISLGDLNAKESLILGDTFLNDLSKLLSQMVTLTAALQTPIGAGPPFTINPSITPPAVQVQNTATQMLNKISTYKSKVSRTK